MSVFSTASGVGGFERVTPDDVKAIHSIQDGRELKEFMRRWGDTNLGSTGGMGMPNNTIRDFPSIGSAGLVFLQASLLGLAPGVHSSEIRKQTADP